MIKRLGLLLLAGCLMQGVAWAGNIQVTYNLANFATVNAVFTGGSYNGYAGPFHVKVTNASGLAPLTQNQEFDTFCVDLSHYANQNNTTQLSSLSAWNLHATKPTGKEKAAWLANQYFKYGAGSHGAPAYQIAIWEFLYEDSETANFNVSSGNATFTSSASAKAALLVTNALAAQTAGWDTGWLKNTHDALDTQDFVAPVPDALSTFSALGLSLFCLGGLARKSGLR